MQVKLAQRLREHFYAGIVFKYRGTDWMFLPQPLTLKVKTAEKAEQFSLFPQNEGAK